MNHLNAMPSPIHSPKSCLASIYCPIHESLIFACRTGTDLYIYYIVIIYKSQQSVVVITFVFAY